MLFAYPLQLDFQTGCRILNRKRMKEQGKKKDLRVMEKIKFLSVSIRDWLLWSFQIILWHYYLESIKLSTYFLLSLLGATIPKNSFLPPTMQLKNLFLSIIMVLWVLLFYCCWVCYKSLSSLFVWISQMIWPVGIPSNPCPCLFMFPVISEYLLTLWHRMFQTYHVLSLSQSQN